MNIITSRKSWLTAPVLAFVGLATLLLLWSLIDPCVYVEWFDTEKAPFSPVEWMTLPLFGLIIPLVWLCPPQSGTNRRQCAWPFLWSVLAVMAIDCLPANLHDWGVVNLKDSGHEAGLALCKVLEEGFEMIMALLALLTLLQSYLLFGRNGDVKVSD